jgi:hypothetical protein
MESYLITALQGIRASTESERTYSSVYWVNVALRTLEA